MNDFKLKLILSLLGGVVFSFVFIVLAFALPLENHKVFKRAPKSVLEKVSYSIRK
ncbi:hypothetical protein [Sulfurimonas sp.]|uniref:hypothetical protein n=1 Tax=Sulfurimonas sp. TaxID=2022749 RepID=UPI002AB13F66|nr:hypothetical protein [Sulfurimonas sp.]